VLKVVAFHSELSDPWVILVRQGHVPHLCAMAAAAHEEGVAEAVEVLQDLKSAREKSYADAVEVEAGDHRPFSGPDSMWASWHVVRDQASQVKVVVWTNQAFLQHDEVLRALSEEAVAVADTMGSARVVVAA